MLRLSGSHQHVYIHCAVMYIGPGVYTSRAAGRQGNKKFCTVSLHPFLHSKLTIFQIFWLRFFVVLFCQLLVTYEFGVH